VHLLEPRVTHEGAFHPGWLPYDVRKEQGLMRVWQIAAGRSGRDYRSLFFAHDVMFMGPSQYGSAEDRDYSQGIGSTIGNQIVSFTTRPQPGDRVIMRFGRSIIGVGEIPRGDANQYTFEDCFRTVYGWALRHTRRVKWAPPNHLGTLKSLSFKPRQQPTFTLVQDPPIVEAARSIPARIFDRPLKKKPQLDSSTYTEEELGEELFRAGISNRNIHEIYAALRQADNLRSWYYEDASGQRPTEHEVVSHMVLPLFLGLGWSHQQMAVEWNNIDMAFFSRTPTSERNCVMVLEAKGMGQGLDDILDQPIRYIKRNRLRRVRYIVATNGEIFLVYGRSRGSWGSDPIAFLDVACLQKRYVIPKGTTPIKTLVMLQPSSFR
jgi:hypothetical protein